MIPSSVVNMDGEWSMQASELAGNCPAEAHICFLHVSQNSTLRVVDGISVCLFVTQKNIHNFQLTLDYEHWLAEHLL